MKQYKIKYRNRKKGGFMYMYSFFSKSKKEAVKELQYNIPADEQGEKGDIEVILYKLYVEGAYFSGTEIERVRIKEVRPSIKRLIDAFELRKEDIEQFFLIFPAINKKAFCEEAGISERHLHYVLSERRGISVELTYILRPIMGKYGWRDPRQLSRLSS